MEAFGGLLGFGGAYVHWGGFRMFLCGFSVGRGLGTLFQQQRGRKVKALIIIDGQYGYLDL